MAAFASAAITAAASTMAAISMAAYASAAIAAAASTMAAISMAAFAIRKPASGEGDGGECSTGEAEGDSDLVDINEGGDD